MQDIIKSDKLRREEEEGEYSLVPVEIPTQAKQSGPIKVLPITTYNDWLVILPLYIETSIILPTQMECTDRGVVVGVSKTAPGPNGAYRDSQVAVGDVILYQERCIVKSWVSGQEPYSGRKLVIVSEKNIFLKLDPVPVEIVQAGKASVRDFTAG